jgi:hypothetical protein
MTNKRKDYCGPYWMPKWLRRILSNKFNASCKIHDLDYATTRFTRDEADARFQDHMNKQAKNSLKWRLVAFIYYVMVRIGGKLSWGRKSK